MGGARRDTGKPPLFRKINTTAHGARGERHAFSETRHSKTADRSDAGRTPMRGVHQGLDYKPLFRFLLSRVGDPWDVVHSEAVARLDKPDPIFWMVALHAEDRREVVRVGESSYVSGLWVDESGVLRVVNPDMNASSITPTCGCCTHTFNGKPFTRKFEPGI